VIFHRFEHFKKQSSRPPVLPFLGIVTGGLREGLKPFFMAGNRPFTLKFHGTGGSGGSGGSKSQNSIIGSQEVKSA
jgi:hypothetical protein